jgi:hypothetical protein
MVGPRMRKSSEAMRSPMNFSMFSRRPVAVAAAHSTSPATRMTR